MIESIKSVDKYLYHYTKCETAIDFILKNNTFRLNNYNKTNDPKEVKDWQFNIGSNEGADLSKYCMNELSAWLTKELKEKTRLLCFSQDTDPLSGNHMIDIFNRGFCKPRMWAQYGDNHKGVCLVFDRNKLTHQINDQLAHKHLVLASHVKYRNRNVIPNLFASDDQQYSIDIDHLQKHGKEQYVAHHLSTHVERLFFEKMNDWSGESEWRYIVFSDSETDLYVNYGNSLVGVMFGNDTEEDDIISVMNMTNRTGVRHMGLKWKNCSPWYDYENLRYTGGIRNSAWGKHLRWHNK